MTRTRPSFDGKRRFNTLQTYDKQADILCGSGPWPGVVMCMQAQNDLSRKVSRMLVCPGQYRCCAAR